MYNINRAKKILFTGINFIEKVMSPKKFLNLNQKQIHLNSAYHANTTFRSGNLVAYPATMPFI